LEIYSSFLQFSLPTSAQGYLKHFRPLKNNSFVGIFRFGEQNLGVIFHPKTSLETADFPYLKI